MTAVSEPARRRMSLAEWRSHRHYSSGRRAGAHPRRRIRSIRADWVRTTWRPLAGTSFWFAAMTVAAPLWATTETTPYVQGAFVASWGWAMYAMMLRFAPTSAWLDGFDGECFTATELRRLREHGWRHVDHVFLGGVDVDHGVVGPGGSFAIETKYRSNWQSPSTDVKSIADEAWNRARRLDMKFGDNRNRCAPIVACWGPGAREVFPAPLVVNDVVMLHGRDLVPYLLATEPVKDSSEVSTMFAALCDYVSTMDQREERAERMARSSRPAHRTRLALAATGSAACVAAAALGLVR